MTENWRVTILGDSAVGKTALVIQFTLNLFVGLRPQPRGCLREASGGGRQPHVLHRGDYSTLRDQWVWEGQGFILVYSVGERSTFEWLDVFWQAMLRVKREKPVFMLVGNKCDQVHAREVSKEEGEQLARSLGCDFIETSAKTALNVERIFAGLVRQLRAQMGAGAGGAGAAAGMGAAGRGEAPGLKPGLQGKGRMGKRCVHM